MDNRVRVIKLGPVNSANEAYSFEDAFGEYSEARGEGRAKRKQRKLERIQNRREVKAARQEARGEKQQARIGNRAARQASRQEKRTVNAELRQQRRSMRKSYRDERKGKKDEAGAQEQGLDTGVTSDMGNVNGGAPEGQPSSGGGQGGQDQGYGDTGAQDQGGQDQGYGDAPTGAADDSGSYDANYGSAEESYDYGDEDTSGDEGDYSDEGDYTGGGDYLDDYNDTEAPFDGVMGAEDRYSEFDSSDIDPEIQDTVNKLVWNKELVNRLENERNRVGGDRKQGLSRQIIARKKRINELQSGLDGYCNADGDFYNADGKRIANNRKAQVGRAYGLANKAMITRGKAKVTPVARGLNANISPNRIVVPASAATGTGINGLDLQADFDAPNAREIKLGADGSGSSSISWKSVAIGVAVGALAIWAVRKYKLIK